MVTSRGVRTGFRMDIKLPTASRAVQLRIARNMQRAAAALARRQIATPTRKTLPQSAKGRRAARQFSAENRRRRQQGLERLGSGGQRVTLKRSFRVGKTARARTPHKFTLYRFRFNFYFYFQDTQWRRFRARIIEQSDDIGTEALRIALAKEGIR